MLQVRKAGAVVGALVVAMVLGLTLLGAPGAVAQRGGEAPAAPTTFETLCVSVHNGLVRAISSGTCQSHETTVNVGEDLPLTLCVNEFTKVARSVDGSADCAASEARVEVTGFEEFQFCVDGHTSIVRVPAPADCQVSQITGIFPSFVSPDSYESLPNVGLDVPFEGRLLANDAPFVDIVSADARTEQGGHIRLPGFDGEFIYNPPAGFVGVDLFEYTARIGDSEVKIPVTINVEGPVIWFVDNSASSDGDGRLNTPFTEVAALNDDGVDPDAPGDVIFIFAGDDNYSGGLALEANQTLIGACLPLAETAGITPPPFTPQLPAGEQVGTSCATFLENAAGSGNVVDLAPNTFVGGLFIVFGDHGIAGANFTGNVQIVDVRVSQVGGNGVDLVNIDGTVQFTDSTVNGHTGAEGEPGGHGILAENVTLLVWDGDASNGGNGGDKSTEGGFAATAGDGIRLVATTASINPTFVNGGIGGDHLLDGGGGTGGDGIVAVESSIVTLSRGITNGGDGGSGAGGGSAGDGMFLDDGSRAIVRDAILIGGDGGSGSGGSGGRGIVTRMAGTLTVEDSILHGGIGGSKVDGIAGTGGDGLGALESEPVTATGSQFVGAIGGTVESPDGLAGGGGHGILARSTSITVRDSELQGALSGSADRPDGKGFTAVERDDGPFYVDVQNNVLLGAGDAPGLDVSAVGADVCLNAVGNSNGNGGSPDDFHLRPESGSSTPTLSVTQSSAGEISGANTSAIIKLFGEIGFGCTVE